MIRAPHPKPLSRLRMAATTIIAGLIIFAVAQIPVPVYIQAAVMIQPHDVKHIYTKTPGLLTQINVRSGDSIHEDDILATLTNAELDDQVRQLNLEISIQELRRRTAGAQSDPAEKRLAEKALATRLDHLQELRQQIARLVLKSPIAGIVVSAERIPEPKQAVDDHSLGNWHGDPLENRNIGALIQPNTHLCSIAPDDRLEAVLYIDQVDRNDLQAGQNIRIKFDHLPDQVYEGTIENLSAQAVAYVPSVLSNKTGGPLPTVTEEGGRERLTGVAWKAIVLLDRDSELFVSGLRGRGRVVVSSRSVGSWLYRRFRNTVHFRI